MIGKEKLNNTKTEVTLLLLQL